ncbi:hypothetical protein HXX76_014058 [Chlamydomonas incerta]|uniref:Uncharacterized protein n=1 Tax=Chlamydomonas incerta TaxID=51695 RepID=A0A835VRB5_CHLIN|nr:hypothetical protein HXX76_014058 [Chlamydomonas incerta]|eukprot:KAG2424900.1 hypothetical protein HXX76_014058 [Chlamydomonas incerta]
MDILSDPEYAMLYVIPGLVFLNDMYPANKTLRNVDGRLQYHTCKKSGAKWYPLEMHQAKPLLLKNVTLQLRKVVDYARNKRMLSKMSPVKACFLLHFLEICESGKPMEISENYPGYAEALGYVCFRYGKLDPDILAGYLYQGLTAALGAAQTQRVKDRVAEMQRTLREELLPAVGSATIIIGGAGFIAQATSALLEWERGVDDMVAGAPCSGGQALGQAQGQGQGQAGSTGEHIVRSLRTLADRLKGMGTEPGRLLASSVEDRLLENTDVIVPGFCENTAIVQQLLNEHAVGVVSGYIGSLGLDRGASIAGVESLPGAVSNSLAAVDALLRKLEAHGLSQYIFLLVYAGLALYVMLLGALCQYLPEKHLTQFLAVRHGGATLAACGATVLLIAVRITMFLYNEHYRVWYVVASILLDAAFLTFFMFANVWFGVLLVPAVICDMLFTGVAAGYRSKYRKQTRLAYVTLAPGAEQTLRQQLVNTKGYATTMSDTDLTELAVQCVLDPKQRNIAADAIPEV